MPTVHAMEERKRRFIRARKDAGVTQRELASITGVSVSTIQRMESMAAPSNVQARAFAKLCGALGCSMDYIFFGTEIENPADDPQIALLLTLIRDMPPRKRAALINLLSR